MPNFRLNSANRKLKGKKANKDLASHPINFELEEPVRYPLSGAQNGIWLSRKIEENSIAYNLPYLFQVIGNLDIEILKESLRKLFDRHPLLFSRFDSEDAVSFFTIDAEQPVAIEVMDYTGIDNNEALSKVQEYATNDSRKSFDLKRDQLYRFSLFKLDDSKYYFYLNIYHLIYDGISNVNFIRELNIIYASLENTSKISLSDIDYYSNLILQDKVTEEKEDGMSKYWSEYLSAVPHLTGFPYDRIRSQLPDGVGGNVDLKFNKDISDKIKDVARNYGSSTFRVLLSAYALLISKYSREKDLCIGVPVADRGMDAGKDMVGMFVNMVPVRFVISDEMTYLDLLKICDRDVKNALENQGITFEKIVEIVNPKRDLFHNSIFQLNFAWSGKSQNFYPESNLSWQEITIQESNVVFDISLYLGETDEGIEGRLNYSEDILDRQSILRFRENFITIIDKLMYNVNEELSKLQFLNEEDKKLIHLWNETDTLYEDKLCIHGKFEEQVQLHPDSLALRWDTGQLTYSEFNKHANKLSHFLISEGVGNEAIVAVCMERSAELMLAIFAILKAGGVYMPIDPNAPSERLKSIIEDAKPLIILTSSSSDQNISAETNLCYLDGILSSPLSEDESNPMVAQDPQKLAYIIYTSGSTGKPKGVMIEHHSVLNRIGWMQKAYPVSETDVFLQKTPVIFDVSIWELFWWSFTGASLVMLIPGGEKDPRILTDTVKKFSVSNMHFVPSMFGAFINSLEHSENQEGLRSLRNIFLSGEALPPKMVNEFNSIMNGYEAPCLVNLYGPTEATVDVSYYNVPEDRVVDTMYIGKPIDNTKLLVVNDKNQIQPIGIPGELLITGVNLARGYINNDTLTNEKFIEIDYFDGVKLRAYKTGDLVKWTDEGEIFFIGRVDNQVKIRGYRIELGDIESKLMSHSSIDNCAVIVDDANVAYSRLLAYYTTKGIETEDLTTNDLQVFLTEKLPEYMIPSLFIKLDEMPLTPSGKVNRKALPEPEEFGEENLAEEADSGFEELSDTQSRILNIWTSALKTNRAVRKNDNFFNVGGNSLLAIFVAEKIEKEFRIALTLRVFFDNPSISAIAEHIEIELIAKQTPEENLGSSDTNILSGEI